MIKNSFIISWVVKICTILRDMYLNSGYYKLYMKISDFFGGLFRKSGVYRIFTKERRETWGNSFEKTINGFFGFFHDCFHGMAVGIGKLISHSTCGSLCSFLLENWQYVSIRYYSIMLFIYIIVRLAATRMIGGIVGPYTMAIAVISCIGMLINVSPAGLYSGCRLKKLIGLSEMEEKAKLTTPYKSYVAVTVSIVIGSIFGLCSLIPMWYVAVAALVILPLMLARPQIGIFLIITAFPFIPTMAVVGLCIIVMLGSFISYLYNEKETIKFDMFDLSVLLFLIAIVFGTVVSYNVSGSIKPALVYIVFVSTVFVIRRSVDSKKFLKVIVNSIITVAFFVSVYGLYQKLTGQAATTWQDSDMFENISGRIYATFGNPNVFGEYLLITIPVTFAALIKTSNKNRKFMYLISLVLQLVCMILTYSRGCWIGIMLSMGLMLFMNGKKLLSVCVLGIGLLPFIVPDAIIERLLSIGNTADSSTSYRVYIWQGTINMLKDFWVTGIGIGEQAFRSVYPIYSLNTIIAPHSHNLYLHVICEMGIVGVVAFVGIIVNFFRNTASISLKDKDLKPLMTALICAMLGYLVQGMFDNVWYNYRIYMFFFIIIALSAAAGTCTKKENKHAEN